MRKTILICDKCQTEIPVRNPNEYYEGFTIGKNCSYDLCPNCYDSFVKTVSAWMKEKDKNAD